MTPGRNDPCPCGSGKKYKHCCLRVNEAVPPEEVAWRRVRRAIDDLGHRILPVAMTHFGPTGIHEAWAEFTLWEDEEAFDPETPHIQVFAPWFLYDWLPDPEETEVPPAARATTAAQAYVQKGGTRLDPVAKRYIEACGQAPFSFHEVLTCEPGRRFRLRDVLLGTELDVFEASGSARARPADLMFAKVVPIDGIAVIDGCGPTVIPPRYKPEIIELRKDIPGLPDLFGAERLREHHAELFELYHDITDQVLNPRPPALANTDGEPIQFQRLLYDIDSAREVFEKLKDLAAGASEEETADAAELDAAGNLVRAEIQWRRLGNAMHSSWENTILGTLAIEGGRLTAEVNSAERARKLRAIIEERLGDRARFRTAKIESARAMLERARASADDPKAKAREAEHERFTELPEVKAALAEQLRAHYRGWVDEKIPALGGRTPREAVRDPDGREAVEALVVDIERGGETMRPPLDPAIVRELREALGLPARTS